MKMIINIILYFYLIVSVYAEKPLNVVATTPELASIAAAIGKSALKITTISTGKEDPHFLQAKPSFMVRARNCDLWIRNGLELEVGWEPVLLEGAGNPKIRIGQKGHFDSGAFVAYVMDIPTKGTTRASGDVHLGGSPHFMTDPFQARTIAVAIAERLKANDPLNTETYREGVKSFLYKLDSAMFGEELVQKIGGDRLWQAETDGNLNKLLSDEDCTLSLSGWKKIMSNWEGENIVTFHKSFNYFANRFKLNIVGHLEPLPGVPPTPSHIAKIVETVKSFNVKVILKEPFYPMKPALLVNKKTGVRIAEVSSYGTNSSEGGYIDFIDSIVSVFKEWN